MDRSEMEGHTGVFKVLPGFSRFIAEHHRTEFAEFFNSDNQYQLLKKHQHKKKSPDSPSFFLNDTHREFIAELQDVNLKRLFQDLINSDAANQSLRQGGEPAPAEATLSDDWFQFSPYIKEGFQFLIPRFSTDPEVCDLLNHELDILFEHCRKFCFEKLLQREQDFLEAQDLAQLGSFTWDVQNNQITNTSQAARILGVEPEENLQAVLNRIHPSDKLKFLDALNKARNNKSIFEYEYRCRVGGDERVIWSRGKFYYEQDTPIRMKGILMDVTDKVHTLQKLQRSEELYKQAQELNKLGNWSWEIQKDRLNWSDELYRIYGLEPQAEKVNFERFVQFIHPEDRQKRIQDLQDQLASGSHKEYYFRIVAADGKTKILHGQSEVLVDDADVPYKLIGTCQDVTEQKELENDLLLKTNQLEKSNDSLREFAYICSHDLKEPLRKISVMGDRLRHLNEQKLDAQSLEMLDKMIRNAGKLQHMIDDILSVSGINAVKSYSEINLATILREVQSTLEDRLEEYQARLIFDELPTLNINASQFRQLFINLILNSLKFSKPTVAPEIRISCSMASEDELKQLNLPGLPHYRISIKDNGIGFEPQYAEKIFSMFQRLHERTDVEGTGIGLSICRRIANHHNGQIIAHGVPGEGAEFILYLPEHYI